MRVVDAAVEDGDADALPGEPGRLDRLAADVWDGLAERHPVVVDWVDRDDRGVGRELRQRLCIHAQHDHVGGAAGATQDLERAVEALRRRDEPVLLGPRLLVLGLRGDGAGGGEVDSRVRGQAHDDLLRPLGATQRGRQRGGGHVSGHGHRELEILDPLRERARGTRLWIDREHGRRDGQGERRTDEDGGEASLATGHGSLLVRMDVVSRVIRAARGALTALFRTVLLREWAAPALNAVQSGENSALVIPARTTSMLVPNRFRVRPAASPPVPGPPPPTGRAGPSRRRSARSRSPSPCPRCRG